MKPHASINSIYTAVVPEDEYSRTAAFLRDVAPAKRRSYVPYLGAVYELSDLERRLTFQGECLLPSVDRGRARILLLFSNAHPESIKNGMFHTAESGVASLWTDLMAAGLFSGELSHLASPGLLRERCLTVEYHGPFCLGFACYWLFPTFHPNDLKALFGRHMEPRGFLDTNGRFQEILRQWRPAGIVSFNGQVFERVTGCRATGYTRDLDDGVMVRGECRTADGVVPIFQTYPAAWRYGGDVVRARQRSLQRIAEAMRRSAELA